LKPFYAVFQDFLNSCRKKDCKDRNYRGVTKFTLQYFWGIKPQLPSSHYCIPALRGGKSTKKPWKKNIGEEYCQTDPAERHLAFSNITILWPAVLKKRFLP